MLTKLDQISPGIFRHALDLNALYPLTVARDRFEERWAAFIDQASEYSNLFEKRDDRLIFATESFVPQPIDSRIPVLLILGNPALQSVHAGMCFAFERGSQVEHRFWRALRSAGWLSFSDRGSVNGDVQERNAARRAALLGGTYESPFLIGIDVFFSFPSPASAPRWAGVAGLVRLFGQPALRAIAEAERTRLATTIGAYVSDGAVVAFQRDAYEYLRDPAARPYSSAAARAGLLSSPLAANHLIPLFAAPPTRYAHTQAFRDALDGYRSQISGSGLRHAR